MTYRLPPILIALLLGIAPVAAQEAAAPAAETLDSLPTEVGEGTSDTPADQVDLAESIGPQVPVLPDVLPASEEVIVDDPYAGAETVGSAVGNVALPDPASLQLRMPESDVVLELPGGSADRSTVSRDAETISVDFPDEEVRTIVRNVADLYDLNVVIPDTLVGSVSLKLRNVTWRQVFEVVLTPLGYTYVEEGNIIKIRSREELLQEPVDTRVFVINFANSADLSGALQPLVNPANGGMIQVDTRSNALIITERPSRMTNIIEIIERLDRPTEQVMIESKFVEVTNRDLKDVGVNWASLRGFGASAEYDSSQSNNYTRTRGNDSNITGQTTNTPVVNPNTGAVTQQVAFNNTETLGETFQAIDSLVKENTAVFSTDAFNVLISALQQTDEIELISNPTVVTMNNTHAKIHIGEEYPIPRFTRNDETGQMQVDGYDPLPLGITLEVTPQVNPAGFITLKIVPEVSSRTGEVNIGGQATFPIVTRRATDSVVTIKSGFTLAIGGLVERNSSNVDTKVPVLGDIPLLGRAFKSKSREQDQRNLIIFITAKVLNADGSTYRDVFSQRRLYEMGIKQRDLPGYQPPEAEEELFNSLQQARDELEQMRAEARLRAQLEALQEVQIKENKNPTTDERQPVRRNQR